MDDPPIVEELTGEPPRYLDPAAIARLARPRSSGRLLGAGGILVALLVAGGAAWWSTATAGHAGNPAGRTPACPTTMPRVSTNVVEGNLHVPLDPLSVQLCEYAGANRPTTPPGALVAAVVRGAPEATTLVRILNTPHPIPSGPSACPDADGSAILADFSYPGGGVTQVRIGLTGCRVVIADGVASGTRYDVVSAVTALMSRR